MKKITNTKQLNLIANTIRQDVVKMLYEAKSGHSAGSIGLADIFTALYFNVLYHDSKKPDWEGRDRFVLSNGHVCPVLYAALANAGYFPKQELMTLRKLGSRLQGHPHRGLVPGIETSSGPLGQGLSQAVGMALVGKAEGKRWRVYCMISDGEQQEGQSWEAAMLASKYKLGNLTAIMDRNNIQIDGYTEEVMPLEPLAEKYRAFGWNVMDVDGHNIKKIIDACEESKAVYERPTLIIAHTIPGKAVSFMEQRFEWHGKPPSKEQSEKAIEELETMRKMIEEEEQ
ncbi:transketolase [Candidatus Micrarchaeota archaeon]|nr:transketolase [Candidatus Micrarchaeota archaeon]MBU1166408.1 transketolase [Candidatus Micrarchaeota archaeon]MBU1886909.1 transketolase [Candidatus Micrarchaeota archaeon]